VAQAFELCSQQRYLLLFREGGQIGLCVASGFPGLYSFFFLGGVLSLPTSSILGHFGGLIRYSPGVFGACFLALICVKTTKPEGGNFGSRDS
jgi:hypothetical protein